MLSYSEPRTSCPQPLPKHDSVYEGTVLHFQQARYLLAIFFELYSMMFVKVVGIMPEHSCSFALRAIFFSDSSNPIIFGMSVDSF